MAYLMRQQQAAFSGRVSSSRTVPLVAARGVAVSRRATVAVRAFNPASIPPERRWPNPDFIKEVLEAFPDKAIATVDEARVLTQEGGYVYLDVRPKLEYEEVGRVVKSVNVPIMLSKKAYDAKANKRTIVKEPNPNFLSEVQKRFPKLDTPLLVACSDAKNYTMAALEQLDEAGYTNLVALKGGYYAWFRVFDNKLNRRNLGEYVQDDNVEGGDSCGVHASGAGFERVDAADKWVPPAY